MSIASEITRIQTNIRNAYTACSNKGAALPQTQNSANLSDTISSIQARPVEEKAVNFYDYDGTLLYSYTKAEALALQSLPAVPTHEGLTSQGWNKSLSDIRTYVTNYNVGNVGAVYASDDGATRLKLTVDDSSQLSLNFYCKIKSGTLTVKIDGVDYTTETEASDSETNHTISIGLPLKQNYPADYVISLSFSGNGYYMLGQGAFETRIFGRNTAQNNYIKSVVIGDDCRIENYAFYNCAALNSVVIPQGVTSIGSYAFYNCISLISVVIPQGVTSIGSNAFQNCASLNSVVIPQGVTSIGSSAFQNCAALNSVVIPQGVTSIGSYVFQNCASINSIVIPQGVTSIGNYAFQNCLSLNSIVIPQGVTSIGSGTFQSCISLNSVVIPQGVTSIGSYVFYNCAALNSVVIPQGVTSIGNYAFYNCISLNSVVIPQGVTSIGSNAFQNCLLMMFLDVSAFTNASSLPTLADTNALSGTPSDQIIYVADQTMLDAFTAATNWSTYAGRFQIRGANT